MAGGGHDRPGTVRDYHVRRPPPFRSGFGRSETHSSWALIGSGSLDVTTPIFHATNQREGDGRICFRPTRKGRGTVSEAANGRPGGGAPVGAAVGTVASPGARQALHPWNEPRG